MRSEFAEVLARESASLAAVTSKAGLACWKSRVVREVMSPQSPYAAAMRPTGDICDRAEFLERWRQLISGTVDRLVKARGRPGADSISTAPTPRIDAQKTAVLILAALHGGGTLSQVTQDPQPLNAALDLALAPFELSTEGAQ